MPKLTNAEADGRRRALAPLLGHADIVGYAAARNTRYLNEALTEFDAVRDGLVARYGEVETDDAGNPTGAVSLKFDSPAFADFAAAMEPYMEIEHEVQVFQIDDTCAIGVITGAEMLSVDWMLKEVACDEA